MRTPQQAIKDAMPAIIAFGDRKPIEWANLCRENWDECVLSEPNFSCTGLRWRPKPEPKPPVFRPWTIDEVPVGAVIRAKNGSCKSVLTSADMSDATVYVSCHGWKSTGTMLDTYVLVNPDGTESACGVEVPQ